MTCSVPARRRPRRLGRSFVSALASSLLAPVLALAADLPPHGPLRVLVVSDEVNPHELLPPQLTQPGEISLALAMPGSGLNLAAVNEIHTDSLALATAALAVPIGDPAVYDVLVYFAHRQPDTGDDAQDIQDQADFVVAVDDFLEAGGGVVSFHHGSYGGLGKTAIQETLGATATGSVSWNTIEGQNVINVAPTHFVTTNGVEYSGSLGYSDPARGVSAGTYDLFSNIPDERYPQFEINPSADDLEVLFASDYAQNGTTHLLGFTHRRSGWLGVVVAYQPGEYQPNALDDLDGNNFQILANAIVYAAGQAPDAAPIPALPGAWRFAGLLIAVVALFGGSKTFIARRSSRRHSKPVIGA